MKKNTQPDYSDWPDKAKVAAELGISTKSVERLAKTGELKQAGLRIPGRRPLIVFDPDTVAAVAGRMVKPSPATPEASFGSFGGLPLDAPFDFESSGANQDTIARALERERIAGSPNYGGSRGGGKSLDLIRQGFPISPEVAAIGFARYFDAMRFPITSSAAPAPEPRFVDVATFAELSGLSRTKVRRLCRSGLLRSIVDKGYRIPREELDRLPEILAYLWED